MKISVIVPFHKGLHYLKDCLNSISEQNLEEYEVILIGDHVEETVETFLEEREDREYIYYYELEQTKRGVAAARNLGIAKATGEFVYFLDSDDYLMKEVLTRLLSLNNKENKNIVFGPIEHTWYKKNTFEETYVPHEAEEKEKILDTVFPKEVSVLNILFRRKWLEENKIVFGEQFYYYADVVFLAEVLEKMETYGADGRAWYIKRWHDDTINFPSLGQAMNWEKEKELIEAYKKVFEYIQKTASKEYFQIQFCKELLRVIRYETGILSKEQRRIFAKMIKVCMDQNIERTTIRKFWGSQRKILWQLWAGNLTGAERIAKKDYFALFREKSLKVRIQERINRAIYPILTVKENWIFFEAYNGKEYAGSCKYIYEYMQKHYGKEYKYIWSVNGKAQIEIPGKSVIVKRGSYQYFYYMARAKYHIYNMGQPEYFKKKPEMVFLQTWHGTPLKKLVFDLEDVVFRSPSYKMEVYQKTKDWDYFISDNEYATEIFQRALLIPKEKIIEYGYPRNDVLYAPDREEIARQLKKKLNIPMDKKVILYAPTWRDEDYDMDEEYPVTVPIDFQLMQERLSDEYVVILHTHEMLRTETDFSNMEGFLYNLSDYDIAELYLISDICITDYSSVVFDFANLKRPLLFYVYDFEHYRDVQRGFYLDMENELPGPLLFTTEEVVYAIRQIDGIVKEYAKRYQLFYEKYCMLDDGFASKRVVEKVFDKE